MTSFRSKPAIKKQQLHSDYIQFSKRVTRWGITLVSIMFIFCVSSITFMSLSATAIQAIGTLYTSYVAIMGITIGAYQGNSSVEKWSKARYDYSQVLENISNNEDNDRAPEKWEEE